MRFRTFPRTGWSISEIGYGMWGMGGWSGSNDDESRAALALAVDCGCNFFDTAWAYGNGHSERLLGEDVLFPACERLGIAIIARVPFDEGSLTGTLTAEARWPEGDWRNVYFAREKLAETLRRVEPLRAIANGAGVMLPELALRFILTHPAVTTTIPGMRRPRHVEQNLACSPAGQLPAATVDALRGHRWERTPDDCP